MMPKGSLPLPLQKEQTIAILGLGWADMFDRPLRK
jgi:hypothetical protein